MFCVFVVVSFLRAKKAPPVSLAVVVDVDDADLPETILSRAALVVLLLVLLSPIGWCWCCCASPRRPDCFIVSASFRTSFKTSIISPPPPPLGFFVVPKKRKKAALLRIVVESERDDANDDANDDEHEDTVKPPKAQRKFGGIPRK